MIYTSFNFFESSNVVLVKMVEFLMMSAKSATPGPLKTKIKVMTSQLLSMT